MQLSQHQKCIRTYLSERTTIVSCLTSNTCQHCACCAKEWKEKGLIVHGTVADVTTAEGRGALAKLVSCHPSELCCAAVVSLGCTHVGNNAYYFRVPLLSTRRYTMSQE